MMDIQVLLDKLGFSEDAIAVCNKLHKMNLDIEQAYAEYDNGDEAFAAYLEKLAAEHNIHATEANLYLYLRFLERTYRTYQEKGIDDSIFFDTMKSLSWISEKCFNESGVYGIPQVTYRAWYRRHVNATIFRIDRLEFEIIGSLYDFDLDGHHISKGDTCIYVHIPGGSPLDFQECENAYDKAREFFHKGFGFDPVIFYCGSWLDRKSVV